MANRRFNKQTTQPLKNGGRAKAMGGGMMRRDMKSGYYPSDMGKQLKASANESYGKFGSKAKKSGKINR